MLTTAWRTSCRVESRVTFPYRDLVTRQPAKSRCLGPAISRKVVGFEGSDGVLCRRCYHDVIADLASLARFCARPFWFQPGATRAGVLRYAHARNHAHAVAEAHVHAHVRAHARTGLVAHLKLILQAARRRRQSPVCADFSACAYTHEHVRDSRLFSFSDGQQ
eukprot:6202184-Pleurochrysis_carterae.AAC.2